MSAFLTAAHEWLKHDSFFSLPRYMWLMLITLAGVENLLGRSKNPRLRSLFAAGATALNWLVEKTRIAMIPVAGPILVNVLRAITGDKDGNGIPDDQEVKNEQEEKTPRPPAV